MEKVWTVNKKLVGPKPSKLILWAFIVLLYTYIMFGQDGFY